VAGNSRGEDRGHVNVGRRVAEPRDRAEQAGFRERNQSLGYPGGNRGRLAGRRGERRFLGAADADAGTARGGELLHRSPGVLGALHGGQQARRVDAGGERERCRRYCQQDHDRVPVLIPGQCPEVAEPVGGGTIAHRVQLADQFSSQPCCLFRIAADRVQQQRPATVGEGGMLGRGGCVVRLDRQREDPVRHLGAQHAARRRDIRHSAGLRLIQLVAPYLRAARPRLRDLPAAGPCLPVLAQPVQLHVPLRAPHPPQLNLSEDPQEPEREGKRQHEEEPAGAVMARPNADPAEDRGETDNAAEGDGAEALPGAVHAPDLSLLDNPARLELIQ